ncbi:DUF4349 domain-containing protein [Cohnella nanjingensis]|uniref:DUF4349 domain-containing protein n=1 Tax=Cohnella nanjingensis TaxID=1387779 RepID=A0A7X0RVP4_9BACL|nr:DUF4349 domain-containing protein [Cohnella nanjingensis]MBB6673230.1 DUF4349 domain-containing protein [Cohnella nanjingensis]
MKQMGVRRPRGARNRKRWAWAAVFSLLLLAGCSGRSNDNASEALRGEAASAPQAAAVANESLADAVTAKNSEALSEKGSAADTSFAAASGAPASADGLSAGTTFGPVADAAAGFNRKMIYNADVVLKVERFAEGERRVSDLIFQSGGYIVQFADSRTGEYAGSTYAIKIPSAGFSAFLDRLGEIPHNGFERQIKGNDVTEEYVDLEARLKAKKMVETRLLAFMDKATKSDDLVRFSNELGSVQQEIEQIQGRIRYLDQNVAYSTINLRLYEGPADEPMKKEEKDKGLAARLGGAMSGSADFLRVFGEGVLTVLAALLPVLAVVVILGVPLWLVIRRSRRARRGVAAERRALLNAPVPADPTATASARADAVEEAPVEEGSDESGEIR